LGVVDQDSPPGLRLSVDLSVTSRGLTSWTASSRALRSSSRPFPVMIWSTVPPVWNAAEQTGPRAARRALSSATMQAFAVASGALV
jgi:hypothetical protein